MTEEERKKQTKFLLESIKILEDRRDKAQQSLCALITQIGLKRQQLRDLGYQAPTATGV